VADVVRCAGGWLFDQVMAGWDVTVLTPDRADSRPLQILGVRVRDLDATLALPVLGPCLQAVAVRTDLYDSDMRVRHLVHTASCGGQAEVRFWGGRQRADLGTAPVSHQLSVAARAFKAQALTAAAVPVDPGEVAEVFQRREGTALLPGSRAAAMRRG
jgi:hypothetical protein